MSAPTWNGAGDSRAVRITLQLTATQSEALALQGDEPMIADASWGITVQGDPENRPHTYYASPRPPSDEAFGPGVRSAHSLGPTLRRPAKLAFRQHKESKPSPLSSSRFPLTLPVNRRPDEPLSASPLFSKDSAGPSL
jgi:hypothetical protein